MTLGEQWMSSMSIERLIESLELPALELKGYLLAEIDELLAAEDGEAQKEEIGDVLFALMAMTWAHTGQHLSVQRKAIDEKIRNRLRMYGSLTRYDRRYQDDRIPELEIGVIHFASGNFGGQWQHFDALHNGTVAEIALLTDAPLGDAGTPTNHCIVTFGDNSALEYDILASSGSMTGGNTVRCRVPNFLFADAKRRLAFSEVADYMGLQILAGLDGLQLKQGGVAHFHSWENGFLTESTEFLEFLASFKAIFSPYLTIGRLRQDVQRLGGSGWTMSDEELDVATHYERRLSAAAMQVVVESARDQEFYSTWVHRDRVDVRSFATQRQARFPTVPSDRDHLRFIAGGRPVREKGFIELCEEMAKVRDWAVDKSVTVSLSILCREARKEKGAEYIAMIEGAIADNDLEGVVSVESKVSMDELYRRIAASSAVLVPSLYDPFCLMPTYAIEVERPAFISVFAGVSENLRSREFTFDPTVRGQLATAISEWYESPLDYWFEARYPSYLDLYLFNEAARVWA
jgi:glycosyltransferase involved in cell wall biosynthesis